MTQQVAKVILFDADDRLLIYLRVNKPHRPYPGLWDLLGGGVEEGESPLDAARREVQEEIGVTVSGLKAVGSYPSAEGYEFVVFWGRTDIRPEDVVLTEGEQLTSINLEAYTAYEFIPALEQALANFKRPA